jgi:hypothetical protein
MAQADQLVENALFPAVRAEINANFAALFSNNSGTTAPTVTVAHMDWVQETGPSTGIWYKRNAANNAWATVATISGSTILFEGSIPAQAGQSGKFLKTNGTVASWASTVAGLSDAQVFTASTTWICPAGVEKVLAVVIGGGGGGGAGGAGGGPFSPPRGLSGGAGGYGLGLLTVTPGSPYTVTVGAGGSGGGAYDESGTAGGTSTFSTISATGGGAGPGASVAFTAAAAGSCSSLDANLRRSNVDVAIPPFVNAGAFRTGRLTSAGTSPVAWAVDSPYSPGSYGSGSGATILGAGGVGGVVALFY